ncbi:MAG: PKD domain-containing protein [Bacteroidales bacterium]|nr:PKD domain-containing protein [Bacteroidales bacterium]
MKKHNLIAFITIIGMLFISNSCQKDEYDLGELVAPTNVTLSFEIVGADAENPNGDGSGLVNFTATALNAITYTFDFGDGSSPMISASGKVTKRFSITGVVAYNVTVHAVGTGGITSVKSTQLEVLSTFEDAEAVQYLTGGSSKTWYWAYDQPGFTGLGPTAEDYGNAEFTWAAWWSISANDPAKACMYDAEFVFTKTATGMTFEQTIGPAFIPGTYAGKIGVEGDVCHDETVAYPLYGVKNISLSPSSSNASVVGQYRGTTMTFSNEGFMCWWVGASEYDIIEVTDNILRVRIKEDDTYAWYHTFTSVKPE